MAIYVYPYNNIVFVILVKNIKLINIMYVVPIYVFVYLKKYIILLFVH